jgi:hypothetical protein
VCTCARTLVLRGHTRLCEFTLFTTVRAPKYDCAQLFRTYFINFNVIASASLAKQIYHHSILCRFVLNISIDLSNLSHNHPKHLSKKCNLSMVSFRWTFMLFNIELEFKTDSDWICNTASTITRYLHVWTWRIKTFYIFCRLWMITWRYLSKKDKILCHLLINYNIAIRCQKICSVFITTYSFQYTAVHGENNKFIVQEITASLRIDIVFELRSIMRRLRLVNILITWCVMPYSRNTHKTTFRCCF